MTVGGVNAQQIRSARGVLNLERCRCVCKVLVGGLAGVTQGKECCGTEVVSYPGGRDRHIYAELQVLAVADAGERARRVTVRVVNDAAGVGARGKLGSQVFAK